MIHYNGVFDLRTVTNNTVIANDDISSNISSFSDLTIGSNDSRRFDHSTVLYNRTLPNKNIKLVNVNISNTFSLIYTIRS